MRVALMTGCAQRALNTDINDATIRLLTRLGCEVVVAEGAGCCGALTHHMGKTDESHAARGAEHPRLDARDGRATGSTPSSSTPRAAARRSRITATCSATSALAEDAARVSEIAATSRSAADLSGGDAETQCRKEGSPGPMPSTDGRRAEGHGLRVAYHAACSLQHGQQIKTHPKDLLKRAGFEVVEPADSHLCCGSAGTYNLMQPEISAQLKARKVATLEAKAPE